LKAFASKVKNQSDNAGLFGMRIAAFKFVTYYIVKNVSDRALSNFGNNKNIK
tara:strand:+ start:996 stop:1151 length:156 start_codon:yes stop_codon:yes gene_type:complete